MFLAADIGGTHTRLLTGLMEGPSWKTVRQAEFASNDFPAFDALLEQFLLPAENIEVACLAVAGPILQQSVAVTHLPWHISADALRTRFGFHHVELLNDFAAQAYGLPLLQPHDLLTLQAGEPLTDSPQLLAGAGTGLGMATRLACSATSPSSLHVIAGEGGHADFAPQGKQQQALYAFLQQHVDTVELETVLSGKGLEHIYAFLAALEDSEKTHLSAAAISAAALQNEPLAVAAMNLFLECYGRAVANLALSTLPRGGIYISGGMAAKNASLFNNGHWLAAFCNKPPMQAVLRKMPVHIVVNQQLGLWGAAERAAILLRDLRL